MLGTVCDRRQHQQDPLLARAGTRQLMSIPVDPRRAWFCGRVRAVRLMLGLGQEALGERARLDPNTIRRIELGYFSPTLDTLTKLARGLSVRPAFLLDTDGPPADDDEIRLLVATLQGKPTSVVRLAVRAAQAIVNECEAIDIESGGVRVHACGRH
jgi:transcriptional regulator with XRE-family HTH domain